MIKVYKEKNHNGFQMTFENGNTISVMFGGLCKSSLKKKSEEAVSKDAEIMIWNKNGDVYTKDGRQTFPFCKADEISSYILIAKTIVF